MWDHQWEVDNLALMDVGRFCWKWQTDKNGITWHKGGRKKAFEDWCSWIEAWWKRRESGFCDRRRWHRWPHQQLLYRQTGDRGDGEVGRSTIASILTPPYEPPAGREAPPSPTLGILQIEKSFTLTAILRPFWRWFFGIKSWRLLQFGKGHCPKHRDTYMLCTPP